MKSLEFSAVKIEEIFLDEKCLIDEKLYSVRKIVTVNERKNRFSSF